ncbi:twin-arginine translocase subunit TatC [Proteiniclasticum sp. SCR006]|uniref:Sec-independent protein translocase protein TatC n=1 Tax=Proteiniclasticum aestuarii TaxID=2817862 RepID=A0A939HC32_9CLOT|nr:twin-arginine translocase subunit TatC [Proteiniclasticum aestuarii]MBO1265207.1 twin-arginine translocase subunit TatC [Proteiniclasticum aestuarii]
MKRRASRDKERNLTLVEHLTELRNRIIYMAAVFVAAVLLSYSFSEILVTDMIGIVPDISFVFISPAELLLSYIKIAVIIGLSVSSPFLIMQIWLFVSPGLEKKERRTMLFSLLFGGVFFILGAVFAYVGVLPLILEFFMGFQVEGIEEMISFSSYLSLIVNTVLSFGLIFELPSIMVIMTRFGIVKVRFLRKNRKYIILVIFVVAAVLTPPDIISQTLLALPMILLFELGIFLSRIVERKRDKEE